MIIIYLRSVRVFLVLPPSGFARLDWFGVCGTQDDLAGIPTQGLGDGSHEAASSQIRRVGTVGVPGWLSHEGLSRASRGLQSQRRDLESVSAPTKSQTSP